MFKVGNDPPTAADDDASAFSNAPAEIDVLANDSDPDADALAISIVTPPSHGTATPSGGTVTYQAESGYGGPDTFVYRIDDGDGGADLATVTVDVTAVVASDPDGPQSPAELALLGAQPNPVGATAAVRSALAEPAHARLAVYDVRGREVAVLLDRGVPAGVHAVPLEAGSLPSGVYLARLVVGAESRVRTVAVVR